MDDKEFDKYIREQLSKETSSVPDDWEEMHQMLVEEEILDDNTVQQDDMFDDILKSHIDKAYVPYNSNHWDQLREKLLTEKYLRRRLAAAKIIELAMLFLFFITTLSIVPFKSELYAVNKYRPMLDDIAQVWHQQIDRLSSIFEVNTPDTTPQIIPQSRLTSLYNWPYISEQKVNATKIVDDSNVLSPLSKRDILGLQLPDRDLPTPQINILADLIKPEVDEKNHILTISTGGSVNSITTPFTTKTGIDDQSYTNIGRHASVTYGVRAKDIELYTGLGVSDVSYGPSIADGIFDSYQGEEMPLSEISDISYLLVNIPLGLRYHFAGDDNWSIYTVGGLNMSMLAKADHEFRPLTRKEIKDLQSATPPSFTGDNEPLRTRLDSDFTKGLMQGGNFLDNFGLSATIGIGFVKNITNKFALYAEPSYTYNFSFDGLGVHNEDINNYRLNLGVRVTL